MTVSFHFSLFEGTLHVDKIHVWFKSQTLRMRYPFQSTSTPTSHRNEWLFRVYLISLQDFIPKWNSRPGTTTGVNSRLGDSHLHGILWWYHVNKCRAMRGNWSELAPAWKSPRCHVITCLRKHPLIAERPAKPHTYWEWKAINARKYELRCQCTPVHPSTLWIRGKKTQ